jgi:two-component system, NtrC family, sensor kinase
MMPTPAARTEGDPLRAENAALERQLFAEHRMAAIGRLLASIVHEISTPIGAIFSNNEVALRSLEKLGQALAGPQPADVSGAARMVESLQSLAAVDKIACERISSVIRGLKTFARGDDCERRKTDLNENLCDTLKLTQAEFRRRIVVETDFGGLPEVECYPQQLNQVFLNLLVNAGQAIEGEGRITIRTRAEGGWVRISISDTGCGMDGEARERIFEPGYTTKPAGVGTGLGLTISRRIVEEKHGGRIEFESEPGAGTTFHVLIPAGRTSEELR